MPSRPAWITNLRRYTASTDIPDDQAAEVEFEFHGSSDRAVVVITGSHIEDELQAGIMRNVVPMEPRDDIYNSLFGPLGLLSSFYAKIKIAYAFRIINEPLYGELETLRVMRNACAHSRRPISFLTPELRAALQVLINDDRQILRRAAPHPTRLHLADRFLFIGKCTLIEWMIQGKPKPSSQEELISRLSAASPLPHR